MKKRFFPFQLNFKQQFFLFFLCSSIVPLLIFSIIFLQKTRHILIIRNTELLRVGLFLSEALSVDALDDLALTANTLSQRLMENPQWLSTPGHPSLRTTLKTALPNPQYDVIAVFDPQGKLIADTVSLAQNAPPPAAQTASDAHMRCVQSLSTQLKQYRQATSVHPSNIIEVNGCLGSAPSLLTSYILPMTSSASSSSRQLRGFLLIGRDIQSLMQNPHLMHLSKEIDFQILRQQGDQLVSVAATNPALTRITNQWQNIRNSADTMHVFMNPLQRKPVSGMARSIRDNKGAIKGYLVTSLGEMYWYDLMNQDMVYFILSFLVIILLLFLLEQRFNKTFIVPMQSLSTATNIMSQGKPVPELETQSSSPQMRQTLTEFNTMVKHLQEKEAIRKNFIATLTHDLRTPLIAQKRTIEFFQSYVAEQLDSQSTRLLYGLQVSNDDLLDMINHLLETFNYDSGKIHLHCEATPLHTLVESCLQTLSPIAAEKQIQLLNHVPETMRVWADTEQLKRVFMNLLGNSVQNISAQDTIQIQAHPGKLEDEIFVSDTGPGLDETIMAHIFDRYPTASGRQQKIGSGLGLFICRMIIELHGGTISVSRLTTQGTTFRIVLPHSSLQPLQLGESSA